MTGTGLRSSPDGAHAPRPAAVEEPAADRNRAAGPDGARAPRAEGAEPSERSSRPAPEGNG